MVSNLVAFLMANDNLPRKFVAHPAAAIHPKYANEKRFAAQVNPIIKSIQQKNIKYKTNAAVLARLWACMIRTKEIWQRSHAGGRVREELSDGGEKGRVESEGN